MARSNDRKGFGEEAQAGFGFAFDLAAYYESYGYRCAFTAQDLRTEIDAAPLVPLLRLVSSGELRPDLVIPACSEARQAYAIGAISVGANYDILISARRCQQTLHDRLSRHGLLLPTLEQFYPNLRVLADHAEDFAAGRFADQDPIAIQRAASGAPVEANASMCIAHETPSKAAFGLM